MNKMRIALVMLLSVASLSTIASASNLAVIRIDSGSISENITFLNHTSDLQGNWIVLSGGTSVRVPEITFEYSGNSTINYTKSDKNINITSPANYGVRYPFTTHRIYANNSDVSATLYGSSDLSGNVDIYLTKTWPMQLRDITISVIDGNIQPFRDLLSDSLDKNLSQPLSGYNISVSWTSRSAGDYVAIVMLNDTNTNNFTIVSATTFQVLEYNLSVSSAPDSVQRGNNYDISAVNLTDAPSGNYTYGAFLIHNDSYKGNLRLKSNGTKPGTNLSADGEFLVDAFSVAGIGLNNVNQTTVQNITEGIIGANNGSILLKTTDNTTSLSLITEDLRSGIYILNVGVWSNRSRERSRERLVAFYQKEVEVTLPPSQGGTPSSGGGGGGGGGGTTGECFDNILSKETRDGFVGKDIPISYKFVYPPVISVNFTSTINAGDISVVVEVLENCSCLVQAPPPGIVYKNLNIWVGTFGFAVKEHLSQASVMFEVSKSWIFSQEVDPSSIKLMQYKGSWTSIATKMVGEDEKVIYYVAYPEAFSPFAIVGEKKIAVPTPTEKQQTNITQVVEIIKEAVKPVATISVTWLSTLRAIPGPKIAYLVLALLLVAYLFRRARRAL